MIFVKTVISNVKDYIEEAKRDSTYNDIELMLDFLIIACCFIIACALDILLLPLEIIVQFVKKVLGLEKR